MNEERQQKPIGLFDSGVGGLTVLKQIRRALPNERCIYLGDTARTPWGTKSPETIRQYSRECISFLEEREVKLIVIACNTASSASLGNRLAETECPVVDVIRPAAKSAAQATRNFKIGVIGTEATIASNSYTTVLRDIDSRIQVFSRSCPLLVPLAEEGLLTGPIVRSLVEHYLASLRASGVDTLILGCTHYPLLESEIRRYLGDGITLIDCGDAVAETVKEILTREGLVTTSNSKGSEDFFLTDTPTRFERMAESFLGNNGIKAIKVDRL